MASGSRCSTHALQSAAIARAEGEGDEMVLACLLHDVGHALGDAGDWGLPGHAERGARVLQPFLAPGIVEPIRHHVRAKRYRGCCRTRLPRPV